MLPAATPHPPTSGSWYGSEWSQLARTRLSNALRGPLRARPDSQRGGSAPLPLAEALEVRAVGGQGGGLAGTQGVCLQGAPLPFPCAVPGVLAQKGFGFLFLPPP